MILRDTSEEPTTHDLIVELREALGLYAGALPYSPQRAWEEALTEVRRLRDRDTLAAFWRDR